MLGLFPVRVSLAPPALALVLVLGSGCDVGIRPVGGGPGGGGDLGGVVSGDGLPCDVYLVLQGSCLGCHGARPTARAPMSLTTYAELVAPSIVDANMSFAQRSLARMSSAMAPMPPKPAASVSAADLKVFQDWVSAGAPRGMCGGGDGGVPLDPLNAAPLCPSRYQGGENINMRPGEACIACHVQRNIDEKNMKAPEFQFAGTLFPTGHEPDRCNGADKTYVAADARIVITDADGVEHPIVVNSPSGNFAYGGAGIARLKVPFTAKVTYRGKERRMFTPQTIGDCHLCHSAMGVAPAPGRVTIPIP